MDGNDVQSGKKAWAAIALELLMAVPEIAKDCGSFYGCTLRVKSIGDGQYEPLYAEIGQRAELTGAMFDILSRKEKRHAAHGHGHWAEA